MKLSRRTAMKSLAALTLAPIVDLRPTIDRERLLSAFSATDGTGSARWSLESPFGVGSLTYATDARSMCRAEIANRVENGERRLPDVATCWQLHWSPADKFRPYELPSIDSLTLGTHHDWGTCPLCSGRRKSLGAEYPDNEWVDTWLARRKDYDVDTNTTLDPSCPLCHGRIYHGPYQVRVCGVLMDYSRVKPIVALPNVRIARSNAESLLFIADGFEGVAMGME